MKYLSLDIETTGLIPSPDNILMLSMVVEDSSNPLPLNELSNLTLIIKNEKYQGQPYALGMNGWIFDIISGRAPNPKRYKISLYGEWVNEVLDFLDSHFGSNKLVVAGKNVASFDIKFLPKKIQDRFHHRVIDPGPMFIDWGAKTPPDLSVIKKKLGWDETVSHDAYEDALDVISVLRTTYPNKG